METLEKIPVTEGAFSLSTFEHAQRVAKMLSSSNLIPKEYQGNIQNTMIALEMANRIGASPLMVMQNLNVIQGKPSWSSTFIISAINSCGKFTPLRFQKTGEGDDYGYEAWALDRDKERLIGPKVDWKMVKAEGWLSKSNSKWKTMPELMFHYRSAAFFGRLYAPEILMGMQTMEETIDISPSEPVKIDKEAERMTLMIGDAKSLEDLEILSNSIDNITPEQTELFKTKEAELKGNSNGKK